MVPDGFFTSVPSTISPYVLVYFLYRRSEYCQQAFTPTTFVSFTEIFTTTTSTVRSPSSLFSSEEIPCSRLITGYQHFNSDAPQ